MPVITTPDDLDRLARTPPPLMPGRSIRLHMPDLSELERARWERWISRSAGVCGCASGAAALSAYLVVAPLAFVTGWIDPSPLSIGLGLAGVVVSSALGKFAGIATGWVTLHVSILLLRRRLVAGRRQDATTRT